MGIEGDVRGRGGRLDSNNEWDCLRIGGWITTIKSCWNIFCRANPTFVLRTVVLLSSYVGAPT
jgi:hypothetical protein